VIVGKGLHDELTGEMFAAVQTSSGASYYVRLRAEVAEPFRQGQAIRLAVEIEPWLKRAKKFRDTFPLSAFIGRECARDLASSWSFRM
jgi:hypothetical protein